jgi:hypothetical protein
MLYKVLLVLLLLLHAVVYVSSVLSVVNAFVSFHAVVAVAVPFYVIAVTAAFAIESRLTQLFRLLLLRCYEQLSCMLLYVATDVADCCHDYHHVCVVFLALLTTSLCLLSCRGVTVQMLLSLLL